MAENSKIEWTTHAFNPWIGCQKVGPGCDNCYAEAMMADRYGRVEWGPHGARSRTSAAYWRKPLAWNRAAEGAAERPRVFCASLADVRIPHLLATPAAVRFVSAEPLLGPVDLTNIETKVGAGVDVINSLEYDGDPDEDVAFGTATLDWVIVGGESGPHARAMDESWARSIRDQCATAGVAFFMKQMTKKAPIPADLMIRQMPGADHA